MKGKLYQLLRDNQDLFAKSDLDLGKTHLDEVSLDTGDSPPINASQSSIQDQEPQNDNNDDTYAQIARLQQNDPILAQMTSC